MFESDVAALPPRLEGRFDVVFTSHGVLCWLPLMFSLKATKDAR